MGQDDRAFAQVRKDRGEHRPGGIAAPVVRVGRPTDAVEAAAGGDPARPRGLDAPRGAPVARAHAEAGERLEGAVEVRGALRRRELRVADVAIGVDLDVVALADRAADKVGVAAHVLAEDEERRAGAGGAQGVEHRGRPARIGAVVEGQRQARHLSAVPGPPDPSHARGLVRARIPLHVRPRMPRF